MFLWCYSLKSRVSFRFPLHQFGIILQQLFPVTLHIFHSKMIFYKLISPEKEKNLLRFGNWKQNNSEIETLLCGSEHFSIECRKNKPKQSQWPIRKKKKTFRNQRESTLKRGQTRVTKLGLVLVLHLIGWDSGASFSGPITEQVKQNQCNPGLHSTLSWKLLYHGKCPLLFSKASDQKDKLSGREHEDRNTNNSCIPYVICKNQKHCYYDKITFQPFLSQLHHFPWRILWDPLKQKDDKISSFLWAPWRWLVSEWKVRKLMICDYFVWNVS